MRIKLGSELKHVYINNSRLYVLYTQLLELMIHHDMQPEPIFGVGKVMRVHIYVRTYAWPRNEPQPAGFFVRKNTRTLVGHCRKNGEYDNSCVGHIYAVLCKRSSMPICQNPHHKIREEGKKQLSSVYLIPRVTETWACSSCAGI